MGTDSSDDYYALLGIRADAGEAELRRAWRRLALRWHPDRAGPAATARFQRVSAAYAALSDPAARADYDRRRGTATRRDHAGAAAPASPPPAPSAPTPGRAPGVMLSRLTGSLDALLASGSARRAEAGVVELFLNAGEAAQGGMVSVSMRVKVRCKECDASAPAECLHCGGSGTTDELFSAWLAVRPGVADGAMLAPSAQLPGVVRPVAFRLRVRAPRSGGRSPKP